MESINSQEALIFITRWSDGSRYVLEQEIRPYTAPEVQHLIDSSVSVNCSVIAVKRMDLEAGTVEDITDAYDIPEVPAYVGTYRPIQYSTVRGASL